MMLIVAVNNSWLFYFYIYIPALAWFFACTRSESHFSVGFQGIAIHEQNSENYQKLDTHYVHLF